MNEEKLTEAINAALQPVIDSSRRTLAELQQNFSELKTAVAWQNEQRRVKDLARKCHVSEATARAIDPSSVAMNEAAERIQKQTGVSFGEALTETLSLQEFSEAPEPGRHPIVASFAEKDQTLKSVNVDLDSVFLNRRALQIEKARKVGFGEALQLAAIEFDESAREVVTQEQAKAYQQGRAEARDAFLKKVEIPGDSIAATMLLQKALEIEKASIGADGRATIDYPQSLQQACDALNRAGWPADGKTEE